MEIEEARVVDTRSEGTKRSKWSISLRALLWIVVLMLAINFVDTVILQHQVGTRNTTVDRVDEATRDTQEAVKDTQRIIHNFEEQARAQSESLGTQAIIDHLNQSIQNGKSLEEIKLELMSLVQLLKGRP